MTISRDSMTMREKSQGGALPVWSGREAVTVWRDMISQNNRCSIWRRSLYRHLRHPLNLTVRKNHLAVHHVRRILEQIPRREQTAIGRTMLLDLPRSHVCSLDVDRHLVDDREDPELRCAHAGTPERRNHHRPLLQSGRNRHEVGCTCEETGAIEKLIHHLRSRV